MSSDLTTVTVKSRVQKYIFFHSENNISFAFFLLEFTHIKANLNSFYYFLTNYIHATL